MNDDLILVLGSKPKSSLPDILVKKVYSANAACEKADEYLKKFQNVSHVSVVGVKQLLYEESVYKRILKSKIDKLVTRGIANLDRFHFAYETIKLSNNLQLKIQSRFFNHGYLDLLIAESKYEENLLNKFKHILNCVRFNLFTGCSTGFFAIIYALHENLNSKILISGVGMKTGSHFYSGSTRGFTERAKVDQYLITKLKSEYKNRLFSLNDDFCENFKINKWNGKIL